jgi:hypothetical protein
VRKPGLLKGRIRIAADFDAAAAAGFAECIHGGARARGMRLLLETHAVLWGLADHRSLGAAARRSIRDADEVHVSAASAWEASIKASLTSPWKRASSAPMKYLEPYGETHRAESSGRSRRSGPPVTLSPETFSRRPRRAAVLAVSFAAAFGLLTALASTAVGAAAQVTQQLPGATVASIDSVVRAAVQAGRVVGVSVAIAVGDEIGFNNMLAHYPEPDVTIVVLRNTQGGGAGALEAAIAGLLQRAGLPAR